MSARSADPRWLADMDLAEERLGLDMVEQARAARDEDRDWDDDYPEDDAYFPADDYCPEEGDD